MGVIFSQLLFFRIDPFRRLSSQGRSFLALKLQCSFSLSEVIGVGKQSTSVCTITIELKETDDLRIDPTRL